MAQIAVECVSTARRKTAGALTDRVHSRLDETGPALETDLRTALQRLEKAGLILTRERLAAEAALAEKERLPYPLNQTVNCDRRRKPLGVAIESYGNLQQVDRAVRSYLDMAPGSPVSVYSDSAADGPLHARLEKIQKDRPGRAFRRLNFAGRFEFETFISHLSAESRARGVPASVLSFALRGSADFVYRAGANRNRVLVDRAGNATLMCDEAGTAECFRVGRENVLELSTQSDPARLLVETPRSPLPSPPEVAEGIRELHQSMLGRPGRELTLEAAANRSLSVPDGGANCLDSLFRFSSRVVATVAGVYGDAGADARRRILRLDDRFRNTHMAARSAYESAVASRRLLWAAETRVLSDGDCLRAGNVALDLRTLLPPFLPSGRNDDGVFGLLISKCYPPGSIAHLPVAIRRDAHARSPYDRRELTDVQVRMSDIVTFLIRDVAVRPWISNGIRRSGSAASALKRIGSQLCHVADWSPDSFEEYVEDLWLSAASEEVEELEELLDRYGESPQFWARDVKERIRAIEEITLSGSPAVAADMTLPTGTPRRDRIVRCQQFVGTFGRLLCHWPQIVAAARELKRAGISMSQPVGRL